jgi:DNA polymerase III epsilon subunit-like protein
MSSILFFDFETGGIDHKRNPILQAAWILELNGEVIAEKCFDVKPGNDDEFNLGALAVNNFTIERMQKGKELSYVLCAMVQDLKSAVKGSDKTILCGHNVHFDINFLVVAADKTRENIRNYVDLSNSLCTCAIARFLSYRKLIHVRNHKLVTLAEHFQIPINAHDALGDVKATREVFYRLNGYMRREENNE